MIDETLNSKIDSYIEDNWEKIVEDITTLVRIPSIEELDKAAPGAPYGPGPAQALKAGLALAEKLGFEAHNCEGHIGYADIAGKSATQFGIIGHMDVVPPGVGWDFEPFDVTRKDGFLVGRGCVDDKGPNVIAMYAVKFLADHYEGALPYTIRYILGANEESGMRDTAYYREHFDDPAFVISPDADFPVCYGEKGGFDGRITSKPLPDDAFILEFEGGMASNAVPSLAHAVIRANPNDLQAAERISIEEKDGNALLTATGIGGHASLPEGTINAIGLLVDYLLEHNLCTEDERAFLQLQHNLLSAYDGSGVGVQTADDAFGPLTLIGGTVTLNSERCIVQMIDIRYPTSITDKEIFETIGNQAQAIGATLENTLLMVPFLTDPKSPIIQTMMEGYHEVTGDDRQPFTIGGGTYAREFKAGASFGPNMPWLELPEWAGIEHSANEAANEEMLKQAMKIYIVALNKIMKLDLDSL